MPLPGAMGGGYSWSASSGLDQAADARIEVVPPPPQPPGGQPSSSSAEEFLVLSGREHGRSSVSVSLARPWDPRSPLAEHRFEVEVEVD